MFRLASCARRRPPPLTSTLLRSSLLRNHSSPLISRSGEGAFAPRRSIVVITYDDGVDDDDDDADALSRKKSQSKKEALRGVESRQRAAALVYGKDLSTIKAESSSKFIGNDDDDMHMNEKEAEGDEDEEDVLGLQEDDFDDDDDEEDDDEDDDEEADDHEEEEEAGGIHQKDADLTKGSDNGVDAAAVGAAETVAGGGATPSTTSEASKSKVKKKGKSNDTDTASEEDIGSLLPSRIVALLDQHIVGQPMAKRAIAVALRNRWRRHRVEPVELRDEIIPKNILMIGPTGVGKTEIARRIARLVDAPFVKVEATKFTEVGFHGRDVDTIIRDLVQVALSQTKARLERQHRVKVRKVVDRQLLRLLTGEPRPMGNWKKLLRRGDLDETLVRVDRSLLAAANQRSFDVKMGPAGSMQSGGATANSLHDFLRAVAGQGAGSGVLGGVVGGRGGSGSAVEIPVSEARALLEAQELTKRVSEEAIVSEALRSAAEDGIVFIDEVDKIAHSANAPHLSGDASNEGVQRDLLPLIEGSIVNTKWGDVDTSRILFVASGAFHACKVSDLLPELQGRLPVRVEMNGLTEQDFYRILTEPMHNLVIQQVALLKTEGVEVNFTESSLRAIARISATINETVENIGARRLHTVLEKIMEELSYSVGEQESPKVIDIEEGYVTERVGELMKTADLSKFIL